MKRCLATVGLLLFCLPFANAEEKIPHIGPTGELKTLRDDFQFTEGPASDGKGNVYFTDIPANRIYKLDQEGKIDLFLEPSNHCNGLMRLWLTRSSSSVGQLQCAHTDRHCDALCAATGRRADQ